LRIYYSEATGLDCDRLDDVCRDEDFEAEQKRPADPNLVLVEVQRFHVLP